MRSEKEAGRAKVSVDPFRDWTWHALGRFNKNGQLCSPTSLLSALLVPPEDGSDEGAFHSVSETWTKFRISVTEEVIWPKTCIVHVQIGHTERHFRRIYDARYVRRQFEENADM